MADQNQQEEYQVVKETIETLINHKILEAPSDQQELIADVLTKVLVEKKSLKDALEVPPETIEHIYQLAYNLFRAGKYQDALSIFRYLKRLDPHHPRYAFSIGTCYHFLKDYENAIKHYLESAIYDSQNPVPYLHIYDCAKKLERSEMALEALQEAESIASDQPQYVQLKTKVQLEIEHMKTLMQENQSSTT